MRENIPGGSAAGDILPHGDREKARRAGPTAGSRYGRAEEARSVPPMRRMGAVRTGGGEGTICLFILSQTVSPEENNSIAVKKSGKTRETVH